MSGSRSVPSKGGGTKATKGASETAARTSKSKTTSRLPAGRPASSGSYTSIDDGAKTGSRGKAPHSITGNVVTKLNTRAATSPPPPDSREPTETPPPIPEMREYLDELRAQFESLVLPNVWARIAQGAAAVAPMDLARRMLAVAPAPAPVNKMAEQVGPEYYDTNGVATILAGPGRDPVSKQAVEQRRRRHTVVALPTAEGRWIYPTWQFDGNDVIAGLADVLAAFRTTAAVTATGRSETAAAPFDEWSIGTWLTTPRDGLEGRTAVDWLRSDLDERRLDQLLALARRTAAAWAA